MQQINVKEAVLTVGAIVLGLFALALLPKSLLVLIGIALVYFVPTLIAVIRKVPNQGSVFVINLFLGWTLVGWVVALAMGARSVPEPSKSLTP